MDAFLERLLAFKDEIEDAVEVLKDAGKTVKPAKIKECDLAFSRYPIKTALKKLNNLCESHKAKLGKKKVSDDRVETQDTNADDTAKEVTENDVAVEIPLDDKDELEMADENGTDDKVEEQGPVSDEAMETEVSFTVTHTPKKSESKSPGRKSSRFKKEISDTEEESEATKKKSKRVHADADDEEWTPSKSKITDALTKKRVRTDRSEKQCPVCGEKFIFESKMMAHISDAHGDEALPYECSESDKSKDEKVNVKKEVEDEEEVENEYDEDEDYDVKPFVCDYCGKIFKKQFQLKYHMNQHKDSKPFTCHVCNKTFMNKRNLKDHSSIHTGDKPYKCETCELAFRTKSMLRQHEATHTRPHRCKYCDATFTKVSLCNNHMIKSHGSKNIAEQLESVKANISRTRSGNLKSDSGEETQTVLEDEEQTIIVKIEDHTDENVATDEQDKTKNGSAQMSEEEKRKTSEEKTTVAESNAVIALDVDGEQVTVFKCAICEQLYPTLSSLEEHELTHVGVGKDQQFSCERCGKTFATAQSLTYHQYTHDGIRPFKCSICEKGFVSKNQLKQHENTHTLPFSCTECDEKFSTRQYKNRHMEKVHSMFEDSPEKRRGPPGTYPCHVCKEVFDYKSKLVSHMNSHTEYRAYKCGVCNKTFKAKKSLRDHTRIHTGEKPFCCETCGKSFINQGQLQSHVATHVKPYACQYCPKRFAIKHQWKQHEVLHIHGKTHVCTECGKAYGSKAMLKSHMEKHGADKKIYPCSECNSVLGSQQALIIHKRLHRGEKPFKCHECGRCFPQKCGLTAHMRTHTGETPFKCDQCDRSFNARNTLKIHKMVHNDQRDHVCEECGRAFLTKSLKERHMATHSSSKNYPCTICGRAYYTIHALQRHKKKMHGENIPITSQIDIKPILQGNNSVQDVTFADTGLSLQQIQLIQKAMGENQQAVRILQTGAEGQEMKIIRTSDGARELSAQEVKIIPGGVGEQIVNLTTADGVQTQEISYIEGANIQEGVSGVQEVRYIQQPEGSTEAMVDTENVEMGEVQTIMVEVPFGQELDANSIMTLLQQHHQ